MSWDYLDENQLPSTRTHYFADSNWEKIGVQMKGEEFIELTRGEWRKLLHLMAKQDIGALEDKDLKDLSPELSRVVSDWLLDHR